MAIIDAEIQDQILVLSFEEIFDFGFSTGTAVEFSEEAKRIIVRKIGNNLKDSISLRYSYLKNVTDQSDYYRRYHEDFARFVVNGAGFQIDFEIETGSVIWKDGEIRITNPKLGILLFLFFGSIDFLANYEAVKAGISAVLNDIQYGYEAVLTDIHMTTIFEGAEVLVARKPSEKPPADRVAREFLQAIREEDLTRLVEQISREGKNSS